MQQLPPRPLFTDTDKPEVTPGSSGFSIVLALLILVILLVAATHAQATI